MTSMSTHEYRIRVCCAASDNLVFPGATHGFVTTVSTNLRVRVGQLTSNPEVCYLCLPDEDGETREMHRLQEFVDNLERGGDV
ncbi:MAG: hypothetical protein ABIK09_00855 [Pseudomonadota bacterium]